MSDSLVSSRPSVPRAQARASASRDPSPLASQSIANAVAMGPRLRGDDCAW
jgi:hypothetical protein